MKKNLILLLITYWTIANTCAQNVLLEEHPPQDTIISKKGPNRQYYGHLFLAAGAIFGNPDNEGGEIKQGNSLTLDAGYRYKLKINKFYSIGSDIAYKIKSYKLLQENGKLVPDSLLHNKEKLSTDNLGIAVFNRFNFGRRGNTIGKFIDIGAYIDWVFNESHVSKDKFNGKNYTVKVTGIDIINPFVYGFYAQIGSGKFILFGKYRYSNMFKGEALPELPRINAGLQIGFSR